MGALVCGDGDGPGGIGQVPRGRVRGAGVSQGGLWSGGPRST